jgi:hypothetical protein
MQPRKPSPRIEFRKKELQRVMDSVSLAEKFHKLKSLTVELTYLGPGGTHRGGQMKYKVNLANAKSVFRFDCANRDCVCGDFDLSSALAEAVARRRRTVVGEATCQGWRNKEEINSVRCLTILRYKFGLGYS